jgi:hypothetical protein
VLVTKIAQLEHILINVSFAYFISAKWSIIVSFLFVIVDIYNEREAISHYNEIPLLPCQKLLWLY